MPVLSTVPLTPSTPQSVATSPTAASLKEMFGSEVPTPQISPHGAVMPDMSYSMMHHMVLQSQATVPATQAAMPAKATAGKDMQTQTIGTQTMEDFACPNCGEVDDVSHCCDSEAAAISSIPSPTKNASGNRGRSWAREELLRFRDSADRVTCGEAASMVVPIFKTVVVGSAEGN